MRPRYLTQPGKYLPAEPLIKVLAGLSAGDVARAVGTTERRIYALQHGEQDSVTLDIADRVLLAVTGTPATLNELYPIELSE